MAYEECNCVGAKGGKCKCPKNKVGDCIPAPPGGGWNAIGRRRNSRSARLWREKQRRLQIDAIVWLS